MNGLRVKRAARQAAVFIGLVAGLSSTGTAFAVSPRLVSNGIGCVYPPVEVVRVARRPVADQRAPKAAKMAAQYWRFKLQGAAPGAISRRQIATASRDVRSLWNTGRLSAR